MRQPNEQDRYLVGLVWLVYLTGPSRWYGLSGWFIALSVDLSVCLVCL